MMLSLLLCLLLPALTTSDRVVLAPSSTLVDPQLGLNQTEPTSNSPTTDRFVDIQASLKEMNLGFERAENGTVVKIDEPITDYLEWLVNNDFIREELCRDVEDCKDNMIYPCKCAKAFDWFDSMNDQCKKLPCTLIHAIRDHLPGLMEGLADAETYVDAIDAATPLLEAVFTDTICPCAKGILPAVRRCITDDFFRAEVLYLDDNSERMLYSYTLDGLWKALQGPLCEEGCGPVDMMVLRGWAQMVDESRARSGTCLDKMAFLNQMEDYPRGDDWVSRIREEASMFWCRGVEGSCVEELDQAFNTCCHRSFISILNRRNLWALSEFTDFLGDDSDDIALALERFRGLKPEKYCRNKYSKPSC